MIAKSKTVTRSVTPHPVTPIRFHFGSYAGYGASDAEALADLTTRILFRDVYGKY